MSEKERIERATAEAFLRLHNETYGTTYRVVAMGDAPDAQCEDASGNRLNVEITLTEDQAGDIQARLGRSGSRNAETLRSHLAAGKGMGHSLEEDVLPILVGRIRAKITKRYGSDTALVVRDSSGVDWSWNAVVPQVQAELASVKNPFGKGIFIVSVDKDRLFRVV